MNNELSADKEVVRIADAELFARLEKKELLEAEQITILLYTTLEKAKKRYIMKICCCSEKSNTK